MCQAIPGDRDGGVVGTGTHRKGIPHDPCTGEWMGGGGTRWEGMGWEVGWLLGSGFVSIACVVFLVARVHSNHGFH